MSEVEWPGSGPEADRLVLMRVRGWTEAEGGKTLRAPDGSQRSVGALPRVSSIHGIAVQYVLEPLEEEGFYFSLENVSRTGVYGATLKKGGEAFFGSSRTSVAEALCIAALSARGFKVQPRVRR